MKDLIRHILKEESSKLKLLNVIENEGIFVAAEMVGGMNNLKRIVKDNPEITNIIDTLKGKLNLIYHSLKEYIEFPMRFEIVGKGENVFKNNSWPIVNLIYDDSNLNYGEKKMFEQFVYDTIGDLNIDIIDIKPEARKMFRDKGGYIDIKYVNGKDWESLDHEIQPEDNDMRNLHREYYTKSYMNESKILQENEDDPTQKILNFLLRRYEVFERNLGDEDNPILHRVIRFDINGETYSISNFQNKKQQAGRIFEMLIENNVIDPIDIYENQLNPYTQKVIRAIKIFINQVMTDKSDINESKDKTQNKNVNLIKQMIYDLFDEVTSIHVSEFDGKPLLNVYFNSDDPAANIEAWFDELISEKIMEYTGNNIIVIPNWTYSWDFRKKIADVYINTKVTRI